MAHHWFKRFDFRGLNAGTIKSPIETDDPVEIDQSKLDRFDEMLLSKERDCDTDVLQGNTSKDFPMYQDQSIPSTKKVMSRQPV